MRPKERRDCGQKDLFRARLDQIVDMGHVRRRDCRRAKCWIFDAKGQIVATEILDATKTDSARRLLAAPIPRIT